MTSGKQSKRRRAEAKAPPVRRKGERTASPRVLIAALGVLILAGVAVGLALAFSGGSSKTPVPARGSLGGALPSAAAVESGLADIPQRGTVLGSARAPLTMVEYVDLQCPVCQAFVTQVAPDVVKRFVRTGKLKMEARPIAFIGPDSERGRLAALAAARQNKFFDFMDVLYFNQGAENTGWLDDNMITSIAASVPGLNVPAVLSQRKSSAVQNAASRYDAEAQADAVSGTPTLLIGRTGKKLHQVSATLDAIAAAVTSAGGR
jgi:protein-disulfide isomerase